MIQVNIATLKAKLSAYLGHVKKGEEVLVMDRSTPVARMVPIAAGRRKMAILPAIKSPRELKDMKFRPLKRKFDVVGILREERDRR